MFGTLDFSEALQYQNKITWLKNLNLSLTGGGIRDQDIALTESSFFDSNSDSGFQKILVTPSGWNIGGIFFDGIMSSDFSGEVKTTDFLVERGARASDHSMVEPVSISLTVAVSDVTPSDFVRFPSEQGESLLTDVKTKLKQNNVNFLDFSISQKEGENRSVNAFKMLRALQVSKSFLTVQTRLLSFENLLITGLSVSETSETSGMLLANVSLREIILVNAPRKTSFKQAFDDTEQKNAGERVSTSIEGSLLEQILENPKENPTIKALNNFAQKFL